MEYDEAIVIFQNVSEETWPETLNYTIRMKNPFMTATPTSLDTELTPHSGYGIIYEKFMTLQWAIDTSYLQLLTGTEVNLNLYVQEFPYMKHKGNSMSAMIAEWMKTVCWMSLLLPFLFLMTRLLEERATGIQELMKMMGVQRGPLWMAHVGNSLGPGLVFAALTAQYAVTLCVLTYVFLWIPAAQITQREIDSPLVVLSGLLPHVPMTWIWTEVGQLEKYGQGLTFATMFTSHSTQSGSAFAALLVMVWQGLFFFLLAWYLDHVYPGQYGQAMPWYFLCQKQYWRKNDVTPDEEIEELEECAEQDQRYFEPTPPGQDVGIKIMNVTKVFPKQRALHNVSLDVFKGEITVLLGHNGAGKTTLMSIITGMLSATEGKVYVCGSEMRPQQDAARQRLGLCPQHNLFFPDLTVLEHVMFFTLLKGGSFAETRTSSESLLDKLGILDKMNSMSSELSGGMKRRLQLACALAGGADVLILDEPTSGLDVETRRELWDLLLALRGSRTVLLSTHFMEEADALGDRVAALHAGKLRCFATPLYLKKAIGTGYRLTFTTIGVPNEEAITSVVTSQVPDATVKEQSFNSISYNLPATSSDKFPELFSSLEYKRPELSIDSIGVGISTLEEVFLRLCSDVDTTLTNDDVDGVGGDSISTHNRLTGVLLYLRQFLVLFKRQINYILYKKMWFLILQVILPILMIVLFTLNFNNAEVEMRNNLTPLNLDIYDSMGDKRVLYNVNFPEVTLRTISDRYPGVIFENTTNAAEAVVRFARRDTIDYNKYLIGIELNNTDAKVLYTTIVRHAAPVGLNLLSNLVANSLLPWSNGNTIVTNNHPLDTQRGERRPEIVEPKPIAAAIFWVVTVVFIILATAVNSASLVCKERVTGARHLHIMSGASCGVHRGTTLTAHTAVAALTLVLPAAVTAAAADRDRTFTAPAFILTLATVLLLGCMAFFALMYLVSFFFAERGTSIILVIIALLFGLILPGVKSAKDLFKMNESKSFTDYLLLISSYVMPPHTLTMAASETVVTARLNALCTLNRDKCPILLVAEHGFDPDACCESTGNMNCYFCYEKNAPGPMIVCLFGQLIVYMILVCLMEKGVFKWMYESVMNARYQPPPPRRLDEMGRAERAYVTKAIALPTKQIPDAMLVSDLHKNYRFLNKSFPAVKGISFSVKKGECFGLLGVNGAGKSTTFQMLTGERCPTRGQVFANGHHLKGYASEYLHSLGYCPQFFGLDEFQTGAENLELTLTLRGLSADAVKLEAASWIEVVGLQKYANRFVGGYSGGCMRRLAAASALACGAPLTLLDEPTAGVDVAARRRVWAALRRAITHQRAVIITSHSMDEMEALCNRIAIMSMGEICALGSPAALRAAHAAGHAVIIKVTSQSTTGDDAKQLHRHNVNKRDLHAGLTVIVKVTSQSTIGDGSHGFSISLDIGAIQPHRHNDNGRDQHVGLTVIVKVMVSHGFIISLAIDATQLHRHNVNGRDLHAGLTVIVKVTSQSTIGDGSHGFSISLDIDAIQPHRHNDNGRDLHAGLTVNVKVTSQSTIGDGRYGFSISLDIDVRQLHRHNVNGRDLHAELTVTVEVTSQSTTGDETDSGNSQLNKLKGTLRQKFNCTLKDEHKTMLHYHINETLQYSELFRELEELKAAFPLVEDYSVTETTLEEVFLSFARPQPSPPPSRPV
uniref:ATP-binding cassette subfamily A member 1 n=1 Tax=Chilo suppressalis TaxID=168631 RepID=A0A646REU1_CHISP|nr:ATP-binding cassette subfamily A member 1 [Chilo suppressalis]